METGADEGAAEDRSSVRGSKARTAVAYGIRGCGTCGVVTADPVAPRMSAGGGKKPDSDFDIVDDCVGMVNCRVCFDNKLEKVDEAKWAKEGRYQLLRQDFETFNVSLVQQLNNCLFSDDVVLYGTTRVEQKRCVGM